MVETQPFFLIFLIFFISYNSILLTIQHLLTIWDTYATNNTLLYSVYTYTPRFTYLYNIKRGGRGCRANLFFKKTSRSKKTKKINYAYFPCWFTEKLALFILHIKAEKRGVSSPGNSQNCLYGDVMKMASLLENTKKQLVRNQSTSCISTKCTTSEGPIYFMYQHKVYYNL